VFGYLKANGLRHGLLVQKYFKTCIIAITCFWLTLYLFVFLICLTCRIKWPMNPKVLFDAVSGYSDILELMQQAFVLITKLRLKKSDTEHRDIERIIDELTAEYNQCFEKAHPF
jgi:hypothetical protein